MTALNIDWIQPIFISSHDSAMCGDCRVYCAMRVAPSLIAVHFADPPFLFFLAVILICWTGGRGIYLLPLNSQ